MILELDIGNSRAKWRLLNIASTGVSDVVESGVLNEYKWSELEYMFGKVTHIRYASVAEKGFAEYLLSEQRVGIEHISQAKTSRYCAGVTNSYDEPTHLGVDRWLAVVAAFNKTDGGCCVIDCGSAITVDSVSRDGTHNGGYIVPGVSLLERALLKATANISLKHSDAATQTGWGVNTEQAVRHGNLSMVTTWLNQLSEQCLSNGDQVYITGGDAMLIAPWLNDRIQYVEQLVFDGLAYVCEVS
ncbi:MAG: type III pantothenate kinase [Pseudomonadota bacterium]